MCAFLGRCHKTHPLPPDKWFLPKTSLVDQWICWGYLQMCGWLKVGVPLKSVQSHSAFYFLHTPVTTCSKWRVKPSLTKGNGGSPSLMKELTDFLLVYHNPGGSLLLLFSYLDCWPRWSIATIATTSWPPTSMSHQEGTILPHSSRLLTFFFLFWRKPVLQRYLGSFTSSSLHEHWPSVSAHTQQSLCQLVMWQHWFIVCWLCLSSPMWKSPRPIWCLWNYSVVLNPL